jgi:hypothetical protein
MANVITTTLNTLNFIVRPPFRIQSLREKATVPLLGERGKLALPP